MIQQCYQHLDNTALDGGMASELESTSPRLIKVLFLLYLEGMREVMKDLNQDIQ
jgi:hypothetical protein